ncbi:MAG: hypothetical protein H0W67_07720 [Gemmatimonadales bacterium]|nr:hypothetical protein [Gemmatimonadales bacterium]
MRSGCRSALAAAALLSGALALVPAPAQAQATASGALTRPGATFRFSRDAGHTLRVLWDESNAAHEERVACLAADVRQDTVFVTHAVPLAGHGADSMGIAAQSSIDRCGPPAWRGTVHTHIAEYADGRPSARFSAQDRGVMQRWYERWHADGVFCLLYSADDAHCEADGVVGGMRARPRMTR